MTNLLEELRKEFEREGIGREFKGDVINEVPKLFLGKEIDENGNEQFFMVNSQNRIIHRFDDENQCKKYFELFSQVKM